MKKFFIILSFIISLSFILTACKKDRPEPEPTPEPEKGIVRFALAGDCTQIQAEEGYIAASKEERTISNISAILFKEDLFYRFIELKDVNAEYSFEDEAGIYKMQLLANLDDESIARISELIPGKSSISDYQGIILPSQPLDGGYLKMLSDMADIEIKSEQETDLKNITMKMPLVRIDILNGTEGLNIKSVILRNAFDNMPLSFEASKAQDKEITLENYTGTGSHENPAINKGVIFIYPDASTEMTVVYDFDGKEASETFNMGESSISANMIWGVMFNKDTKIDVTEIAAPMDKGYKPEFTVPATEFQVGAALKGDALFTPSSAYNITPYEYETSITNAYFAFFKDGKLYSAQATEKYGQTQFQTIIHESGFFSLIVVANASEELGTALENAEPGIDKEKFLDILTDQKPEVENMFLMISDEIAIDIKSQWTYVAETNMHRLSSRIDIINAVPGMTISKVVLKNRAIQTPLLPDDSEGDIYETTEYTGFEGTGDIKNYPFFAGKIYTYQNTSSGNAAELTIHYSLNGEDAEKTVDFSSVGGIHYGKLYSVVLTGSQIEYTVKEEDWQNGYAPVIGNEQEKLNSALAVNHFTEFNVKEIDDSGNVTFCDNNSVTEGNTPQSAFLPWDDSFKTKTFTDENGKKYRVPTKDEMLLLFPHDGKAINFQRSSPTLNIDEITPSIIFDSHNGGTGKSVFRNVQFKNTIGGFVVYGIRFKDTDQYSAYRYEYFSSKENNGGYISIKIKALYAGDDVDIIDISDAMSPYYWSEGYLEFRIPLEGAKLEPGQSIDGKASYSTIWCHDTDNAFMIFSSFMSARYFPQEEGQEANLRLVSVE